jgi:hypothetical protein
MEPERISPCQEGSTLPLTPQPQSRLVSGFGKRLGEAIETVDIAGVGEADGLAETISSIR